MKPELTLRPARAFDAIPCATIVNEWVEATGWMPRIHTRAEIVARCRERQCGTMIAECAGEVAGFLSLDGNEVTSLFVASTGHGTGAALLDRARKERERLTLWTFAANRPARRFYEREGFLPARRSIDNAERLPDIEYVWTAA
ncbi:GNAT family N-acetyltransferase [Paracoccus sp. TK19116]|uniref:GNAT family N-acetyltransferase n=2 Tax=Paracoccus albicereus TaxID=2922394 RepID=A0ABT1MN86_9RHOB|nr:GNAT family N-acetyltransferase [Paracoccus albicereus]